MFGKRIQVIMQQLQKALTPRCFRQESFITRTSLSWALLPGDPWRDGMGTEAPSVHQLCSQGGSVRAGGQHWSNIEQGPLILKLQIPTPWAKTLPILTQRFPKQDLLPKSQECYSWRCDHELGRNSAVYGTVWLMSPSGTALQREMGLSKEKKGGFLISTSSECGPHFLKCHSEWVKGKIHKCEIKLLREVPGSGWVPWKKCSIALCTTSRWKSQWNEADLKLLFLPTLAGFSL